MYTANTLDRVRVYLSQAPGNDNICICIVLASAANKLSCFPVCLSGDGAGVYYIGIARQAVIYDIKSVQLATLGDCLTFILVDFTAKRVYADCTF